MSQFKIENLSAASGLPILIKDGRLLLSKNVSSLPVQTRTLDAAKTYFKDKNTESKIKNLYLMYRGVKLKKDAATFKKRGLQYDITVINPGLVGNEFIKTIGHRHPLKPKTKTAYPEIYEVIYGNTLLLLQEIKNGGKSSKIYLIKARAGEKIIIPPGFGHISINIGNEPLVLANIEATNFKSDYSFFKKYRGAAYYVTHDPQPTTDNKKIRKNVRINQLNPHKSAPFLIEKNPDYKNSVSFKIIKPKKIFETPLYQSFIKNPEKFDFLKNPEKYRNFLTPKNLFRN